MTMCPMGPELFHVDRQDEGNSRFL